MSWLSCDSDSMADIVLGSLCLVKHAEVGIEQCPIFFFLEYFLSGFNGEILS